MIENNSSRFRLPDFNLANALVQEFVQDLEVKKDLSANANQRLDRLSFEVNRLVDTIQRGPPGVVNLNSRRAMRGLLKRIQYVEELSQDPEIWRQLFVSRIFYKKILELEVKLCSVIYKVPLSEQDVIRETKQSIEYFLQSLKKAIPDDAGLEEGQPVVEGAVSAEDWSMALRCAMERVRDVIGPSEEELRAEGPLGSKCENLIIMGILQDVLQIPGLFIPRPIGISSPRVEAFLRDCDPSPLQAWAELCALYHHRDVSAPFLMQDAVKAKIRVIQQGIQTAFNQAAENPEIYGRLAPPALNEMILSLQKAGDYAIVRSTGAEDTKAAANAGGNISVPYVLPTRAEIMRACGAVVASYFDVDSLKNRLDSGQNPFAERLQIAVLAQQMIGEPVLPAGLAEGDNTAENIPTSFVCFSGEPLWVGNEPFRIVRVVATKGNGVAVVEAQGIPTDSWVILYSAIHPHRMFVVADIQKKTKRKAAVQKGPGERPTLCDRPNPREIVKKPSLSSEQLRTIFTSAMIMEARFGGVATDFEGICRKEGTYFVQARPVNRPPHAANYFDVTDLDERHRAALLDSLQAFPIVPGRSNVVEITSPDQLVIAETLDKAEKLYHAELGHRLVIVSKPSPLLSHAVVNFSHLGVPCLRVQDMGAVVKWRARIGPHTPLEVCTQTAKLYLWDQRVANPQDCVKEGFGKHPAKLSPSPLSASLRLERPQETPEEICVLLQRIRGAMTRSAGLDAIAALENHPLVARIQLASRRYEQVLRDHPNAPAKAREIGKALSEYAAAVRRAFAEAKPVFSKPDAVPKEEDHLQRLFRAEVLEAILLEPVEEPGAVGRCSLMQVESMSRAISALIAYQQQLPYPARFADLLLDGSRIPNPDPMIFNRWQEFLLGIESAALSGEITPTQVTQFKAVMKTMRKSGVLPMWFIFYFKPDADTSTVRTLLTQFEKNAPLLTELTTSRLQIKRLAEQMDRFAYPATFEEAWKELEVLVTHWSSKALFKRIQTASPLAQNIAYQTMERLVTTLDTAVKTMKIGVGFSDEVEQTRLFKQMLIPYHELMAAWALNMVPNGAVATAGHIPGYVARVKDLLEMTPDDDPKQLLPSGDFHVNAALLTAGTSFLNHQPRTLEDILMLEHQNLLAILSALNLLSLPADAMKTSYLPLAFQQVIGAIEGEHVSLQLQRIGLTVTENEIIYRGNRPLREHSSQLELIYNKSTQRMTLTPRFLGNNEQERWGAISDWVYMLNETRILRCEGPVNLEEQEISFVWNVDPENISEAMTQFFRMGNYSTTHSEHGVGNHSELVRYIQSWNVRDRADIMQKLVNYSYQHPRGPLARQVIRDSLGTMSGRVVCSETIQRAAEQLLGSIEPTLGFDLFWELMMRKQITRPEIADIFRLHFKNWTKRTLDRAISMIEEISNTMPVPTIEDIQSPDAWIRERALYRLNFLASAIKEALNGARPMEILEIITPENIKLVLGHLVVIRLRQAELLVNGLLQAGRITRAEIADVIGRRFHQISSDSAQKAMVLAEDPLTDAIAIPTLEQITNPDPWIGCRALHRLHFLIERRDPEAIARAKQGIKFLLETKSLDAVMDINSRHLFKAQWSLIFGVLIDQGMMYEEAAEFCLVSIPNGGLTDLLIEKGQGTLVLEKVVIPVVRSLEPNSRSDIVHEIVCCLESLITRNIGLQEAAMALRYLANTRCFANHYTISFLDALLKTGPDKETHRIAASVLVKVAYIGDSHELLLKLLKDGFGTRELEELVVANFLKPTERYNIDKCLQLFELLFRAGSGFQAAKQCLAKLSKDPKRKEDLKKLFQSLPRHQKIDTILW